MSPIAALTSAAALVMFALPPVLAAQDTQKPDVKADDASHKLLREWQEKEYHLGRAGVKKLSCTVHATCKLGPAAQPQQATAKYLWDGTAKAPAGKLIWSNSVLGRQLAQSGWGAEQLDNAQIPDYLERWLDGCELFAAPMPTHTHVTIRGHRTGLKGFKFDKDGVLEGMIMEVAAPRGGRITIDCHLAYHRDGEKFHVDGFTYIARMPNGNTYETICKLTYKQVQGFHVLDKVQESSTLAGETVGITTLVFTDHKVNDQVLVPKEAKEATGTKGKAGSCCGKM